MLFLFVLLVIPRNVLRPRIEISQQQNKTELIFHSDGHVAQRPGDVWYTFWIIIIIIIN